MARTLHIVARLKRTLTLIMKIIKTVVFDKEVVLRVYYVQKKRPFKTV